MSKHHQSINRQVVSFYWSTVKTFPIYLIGTFISVPLATLTNNILPPLILAQVLGRLSKGDFIAHQPWQSFGGDIVIYTVIALAGSLIFWRIVDSFNWRLEAGAQRLIARKIFDNLTNQGADFHANHFSGSLVSQSNKLLGAYVRMADTTIYGTIPLIVSLIATSVILLPRAPLFVLALALFSIFYITAAIVISKHMRNIFAKHAAAESAQTGYLADVIGNVMAVKSFAGEEYESKAFRKATARTHDGLMGVLHAHQKQMGFFGGISASIWSVSFIIAIISVVNFSADIGTVFLILSYASSITGQLFQFSNNALRNYNRAIGDARDMVEIFNLESEIKDPIKPTLGRMNRGAIKFDDVYFTHKDAETAIFSGLELRIKPGEKVGLVGHSGSGKTSLTRLLLRFSDISSGTISIDGQDITSVTQADLRRAISYVPQEPILFHRTIAENISYGRPQADKREIEAIAHKANADEFIDSLQHGYDTVVGERGVKLSGGQRQRIAIARAMIKNAPILVLDEATSALDSESEGLIQDALWKLMEGRTAIVIAHRLSTIQRMDRIIVLEDGKIVEEGSHKDLIYKQGVYAKLWERQSGGFLED